MPAFQSERKKPAYKVIWLNSKKCVFETFFKLQFVVWSQCAVFWWHHTLCIYQKRALGYTKWHLVLMSKLNQTASPFFFAFWQSGLCWGSHHFPSRQEPKNSPFPRTKGRVCAQWESPIPIKKPSQKISSTCISPPIPNSQTWAISVQLGQTSLLSLHSGQNFLLKWLCIYL